MPASNDDKPLQCGDYVCAKVNTYLRGQVLALHWDGYETVAQILWDDSRITDEPTTELEKVVE